MHVASAGGVPGGQALEIERSCVRRGRTCAIRRCSNARNPRTQRATTRTGLGGEDTPK